MAMARIYHNAIVPATERWMLWYAIMLHWIWGATLLSSSAPLGITAIATVVRMGVVSAPAAGAMYLIAAAMGVVGIYMPRIERTLFLIPQTMLLWIGAYGAARAMILGQFADGIIRPSAFLVTDQAPAIIAALCYTIAVGHSLRTECDA